MEATCWTLIENAAKGESTSRDRFADSYGAILKAYFGARWRAHRLSDSVPDAVQEVFVECFKEGGLLGRADREREGGFRPWFFGAAKRIALRFEEGRGMGREAEFPSRFDAPVVDEKGLATIFDRAWAAELMRQAAECMAERAEEAGERERRWVELLRMRFEENRPIREIAKSWDADPAALHHEYAKARREFRSALLEVVGFHAPGSEADIERQAEELIALVG